jgi:serine/threonine-protein kinase
MVHRDIKPANLHLGRVGLEYDFVKVLDFGLVKSESRWLRDDVRLTAPESMSGTPAYMAPEMASGEPVDGRADLYALGCVGYYMLTGALVFEGENALQMILKHLQNDPVPPSSRLGAAVPAELERVILWCLGKSPRDRPADAGELGEAFGGAGADGWTQHHARIWWETKFTPAPADLTSIPSRPSLLEVAAPSGSA